MWIKHRVLIQTFFFTNKSRPRSFYGKHSISSIVSLLDCERAMNHTVFVYITVKQCEILLLFLVVLWWSIVSKCDRRLAETFPQFKWSFKLWVEIGVFKLQSFTVTLCRYAAYKLQGNEKFLQQEKRLSLPFYSRDRCYCINIS